MPPLPSLTKKLHSEPYEAINPARPELAVWKDKVAVVTGGGGAIGAAEALAFARAGSNKIAVLDRREGPLQETKKMVEGKVSGVEVLVVSTDLSNAKSVNDGIAQVVQKLGKINVLMANAGYLSHFGPITEADPDEWWTGFDVNAKGAFNLARAFLPNAADGAIVVETSSCVVHLPGLARATSYVASKLVVGKR